MQKETKPITPYRVGEWLPSDQEVLDNWLAALIEKVDAEKKEFHPIIEEFKAFIDSDPEFYMLFNQMFTQVPEKYKTSPVGKPQVRSYTHMLELINEIMTQAPDFNETGLVGFPINAILDYSMGTTSGFAAFLNDKVNRQIKKVLNEWGRFLKSKDSRYVLSKNKEEWEKHVKDFDIEKNSWFGSAAKKKMPNFDEEFKCDPTKPYHGFTSWDDFFTREFREGQRPIAAPDDNAVIVNACESAPLSIIVNVKKEDKFWIKGQPYSLRHMLANDSLTDRFVGGTIYQAFLNALSYHRWHSPVMGTIVKAYVIDGSYYSEALVAGFDPSAPNDSQRYITEVATRAVIFIEADNKDIGLMCFVSVGMAEVSTCDITVYEGQHIEKGEQLGMFHFGGSTHCMIFNPDVNLDFDMHGQEPGLYAKNIDINAKIATASEKRPTVIPNDQYLLTNGIRSLAVRQNYKVGRMGWDSVFMSIDDLPQDELVYTQLYFEGNPFGEPCYAYYWRGDLKYYLSYSTRQNMISASTDYKTQYPTPSLKLKAEGELENFVLHFYDEDNNPIYYKIEDNTEGMFLRSESPHVTGNYSLIQIGLRHNGGDCHSEKNITGEK